MVEPDTPNASDQQVADVAAAQGRVMQLLAKAVAQRLAHEGENPTHQKEGNQ